jgi:hypothetical protein
LSTVGGSSLFGPQGSGGGMNSARSLGQSTSSFGMDLLE